MDTEKLRQILRDVRHGDLDEVTALELLKDLPYEDLGYARLDHHRDLRKGSPEVVFCQGKTPHQVCEIFARMAKHHAHVLGTRANADIAAAVIDRFPETRYDPVSRLLVLRIPAEEIRDHNGDDVYAAVVSAGTADIPVAEEAAQTLEFLGNRVQRVYDVGVAGLHRLIDQRAVLDQATVIISIAGMEGALTSVIAGLVSSPVIGVPTSVGYGASFQGLSALLAMLNSCAPGVAVVNIDNGFGAAQFAHLLLAIAKKSSFERNHPPR